MRVGNPLFYEQRKALLRIRLNSRIVQRHAVVVEAGQARRYGDGRTAVRAK